MPFTPEELEAINRREAQQQAEAAGRKPGDTLLDWTGAFVRSSAENTLNLFGVPKSASNIAWEETHPLAGTAASFLGIGGTYGGFFKATKSLGRIEKTLDSISGIANSPIRGGIAKEALRFTPLESARIIGTAIGEPERLDEQLFESGINLALSGAFGALGGLPAKYGKVDETLKELAPNIDLRQPATLQLRQLREEVAKGTFSPEALPRIQRAMAQLDGRVRFEAYAKPTAENAIDLKPRYITNLDSPSGPQRAGSKTALINSLFVPGGNKIFKVQRLHSKADDLEHGLDSMAEVQEVLGRLPKDATSYMNFPRLVTLRAKPGKESVYNLVQGRLASYAAPIGDGSYMLKEADRGLFTFVKKVKGDPAKMATGDQFVTFQTDRPDFFGGRAAAWMDKQVEAGMWWARQFPVNQELIPGSLQALIRKNVADIPLMAFEDYSKAAGPLGAARKFLASMGLKQGEQTTSMLKGAAAYIQEYAGPKMAQFIGDGPGKLRARWLTSQITQGFDAALARAEAAIYGMPTAEAGKSLSRQLLVHGMKGLYPSYDKTPFGLIQKLSMADRKQLGEIAVSGMDLETARTLWSKNEMSEGLFKLLNQLDDIDKAQWSEMNAARKSIGMPEIKGRKGHYLLSHLWDGDVRLRIRNEAGETIYMVGADSRGEAIRQADFIIDKQGMKGKWKYDASKQWTKDLFLRGKEHQTDDVSSMLGINKAGSDFKRAASAMESYVREAYDPSTLTKRKGIGGFSIDMSDKALADRLLRQTRQMQTHIADIGLRAELLSQMDQLGLENPAILRQVQERWNNFLGISGKFSQAQNEITDKLLAPVLGNNSATKIVGAINTAQHNLQLGSFNFMYPTVNMLSFMTTVLPQVSFVATADAKTLTQWYTSLMAHGSDGLAKRAVHFLDPMKMVARGFNLMGKADEELTGFFKRAANEGIFAPRLVEEHIGADAQLRTRLSGILQEQGGFVKFIQYLSEWMPNKSEQFSRLHAFTTGFATGKELVGLEGEALYRFAKEFTTNTMFGYNMVDRAKMIQGPLGSFWGLYKNWQMHYLSWMMAYAGQAGKGNFAPLLWSQAGVATVGGLGGTSAYGIADAFSRIGTGESAFSHLYKLFSTNDDGSPDLQSDVAFYGLPAFLGVSLQSSAGSIGANPAKDAGLLFSFVQADRAQAIGRAVGSAIDTWQATNQNPFSDKLVRDQFLKAVAPRSLIRTAQVLEGDYIRSLNTGNPVIQGLSPMERFAYGLGFDSPEIDRTFRVSDELFSSEEKRKVAVRYFARQVVEMQNAGAWEDLTRLSQQIMISGVGMDSVLRSAENMKRRSLQDVADYRLRRTSPDHLRRFVEPEEVEVSEPPAETPGEPTAE